MPARFAQTGAHSRDRPAAHRRWQPPDAPRGGVGVTAADPRRL